MLGILALAWIGLIQWILWMEYPPVVLQERILRMILDFIAEVWKNPIEGKNPKVRDIPKSTGVSLWTW